MKAFKIHMFGWLAMLSLAGVWTASGQPDPAPVAPTNPDNAPGKGPANTVQLHRVIYVHAGDSGNLLQQRKFVDQYAAPPQLFPVDATPDPQYMPPTIQISNEEIARQRHAADNDKNWMLLTPEEILGVAPEKAANDPDRNLTAEERYLKRNAAVQTGTNDSTGQLAAKKNDLTRGENNFDSFDRNDNNRNDNNGNSWSRNGQNRLTAADRQALGADAVARMTAEAPNSPWANSIWGTPQTEDPVQAALKQKADMTQFQHLLAPENPATKTGHFGEAAATPNVFNPQPNTPAQANTAAETYSLLKDNIGRPAPKPTLLPPPTTKPSYYEEHRHKPEAPPWLSQPGIHPY